MASLAQVAQTFDLRGHLRAGSPPRSTFNSPMEGALSFFWTPQDGPDARVYLIKTQAPYVIEEIQRRMGTQVDGRFGDLTRRAIIARSRQTGVNLPENTPISFELLAFALADTFFGGGRVAFPTRMEWPTVDRQNGRSTYFAALEALSGQPAALTRGPDGRVQVTPPPAATQPTRPTTPAQPVVTQPVIGGSSTQTGTQVTTQPAVTPPAPGAPGAPGTPGAQGATGAQGPQGAPGQNPLSSFLNQLPQSAQQAAQQAQSAVGAMGVPSLPRMPSTTATQAASTGPVGLGGAPAQASPGAVVPVAQAPTPAAPGGASWQQWVTQVAAMPSAVLLPSPVPSPYPGFEIFATLDASFVTVGEFCLPGFVRLDEARCGAILPKVAGPGLVVAGPWISSQMAKGLAFAGQLGQVPPELAFAPRFASPETYRNSIAYPVSAAAVIGSLTGFSLLAHFGGRALEALRD